MRRKCLAVAVALGTSLASVVLGQETEPDAGSPVQGAPTAESAQEQPAPATGAAQDPAPGESSPQAPQAGQPRNGSAAIQYTPMRLPEEGLGDFLRLEDKRIRLPLSIEDAVRIAIRNNLELQVETYNQRIASRRITIERAVFDPFFNLSLTHSENREPTVSPLDFDPLNPVLGVQVNPFDVTTLRSSLRGTTLLGTSWQVSAVESRFDSPEASLFALNPRYSSRAEVTVTQPLLRGAWYGVNSANIRIARNNLRISEVDFRLAATDTIYSVVSAYWDLVFAHRNYDAKASALKVAIDQLKIDRQRERVGAIARIELITPESQVARRKTEFDRAITLLETTRDNLLVLMNYTGKESLKRIWERKDEKSPFDNILVVPTTEPGTEAAEYDRDVSLGKAFGFREEYERLELLIKNQEIVVEATRNRLLPALDLTGTWTQLGLDDSFRGSTDSLGHGRFYDWQVGVALDFPLSLRGPLAEYRNAKDDLAKFVLQKQSLENTLVIEVDRSIRDVRESFRTVQNLHHEVELQVALLEAEKAKLRVGRSIAYTVSQIENDLVDIRTQENGALTSFEKFKAAYERAVGTLLESFGVVLVDDEDGMVLP